jgi:bifunctional DNase/RNase
VVTAVEEQRHFFATIDIERDGERRVLSARPSDAVALALRAYGADIYVADAVMVEVGVLPASDHSN